MCWKHGAVRGSSARANAVYTSRTRVLQCYTKYTRCSPDFASVHEILRHSGVYGDLFTDTFVRRDVTQTRVRRDERGRVLTSGSERVRRNLGRRRRVVSIRLRRAIGFQTDVHWHSPEYATTAIGTHVPSNRKSNLPTWTFSTVDCCEIAIEIISVSNASAAVDQSTRTLSSLLETAAF